MELTKNVNMKQLKQFKNEITRFIMAYEFALDEMNTKIDILKKEFEFIHEYSPIEHVSSRIKTPESIVKKVYRKNHELSFQSIKENINDIAGIRISCPFISDIYRLYDMLTFQKDIQIKEVKDYIAKPKPNGYQSLHVIVEIPVYMSDREERVCVEVQIRTIAMDFWASLEHKIFYKYNKDVPGRLLKDLKDAADSAAELDRKMERIHKEINEIKDARNAEEVNEFQDNKEKLSLPMSLIESLIKE
ncbi:GTP pyrophosphokinase family protein [Evansella sp. AB-rgal1]|uniref:GTP pyrophosphokinase n=1 Tax=Evansella sp. AB-rgal1 TaxID=3242696 RepID=UPI00359CED7E